MYRTICVRRGYSVLSASIWQLHRRQRRPTAHPSRSAYSMCAASVLLLPLLRKRRSRLCSSLLKPPLRSRQPTRQSTRRLSAASSRRTRPLARSPDLHRPSSALLHKEETRNAPEVPGHFSICAPARSRTLISGFGGLRPIH